MMIKLFGAVLTLSAGTAYGFYQALHYARRPKQIRQLIQALQRLETEIIYGYTPLAEAMLTISRQNSEPLSSMLRRVAEELYRQKGSSTREIWHQAVKEGWMSSSMKSSELESILQLGHTLGLTDRTDQVKHLRLAVSQLQADEEQAREEQKRYEKMWKSLGVLVGALIVILMY